MTVPARFGVLRLIATLFKVLAWIVLIGSILGALALGLLGPLIRQSLVDADLMAALGDSGGVIAGLLLITLGILGFLSLFATGENIQLQLAIEENTRLTAALLLRLDEENRPAEATPYTYYGQVVED